MYIYLRPKYISWYRGQIWVCLFGISGVGVYFESFTVIISVYRVGLYHLCTLWDHLHRGCEVQVIW